MKINIKGTKDFLSITLNSITIFKLETMHEKWNIIRVTLPISWAADSVVNQLFIINQLTSFLPIYCLEFVHLLRTITAGEALNLDWNPKWFYSSITGQKLT